LTLNVAVNTVQRDCAACDVCLVYKRLSIARS